MPVSCTSLPNDRHPHCITPRPRALPSTRSQRRCTQAQNFLRLAALLAPHCIPTAAASPLADPLSRTPLFQSRDDQGQATTGSMKIWVPVAVVLGFLVLSAIVWWWRSSFLPWLAARRLVAERRAGTTGGARDLTAEQLAGTINGAANPTAAATPAPRSRRTRRPRRTPSQISTTSLPAYAKEPGEEELVIFRLRRGPEDMEDAGMPTATVVMEPLSEDGEESVHSRTHSRHHSQASDYPEHPSTPIDQPLLEEDEDEHEQRRSGETMNTSEDSSSLMRVDTNTPAHPEPDPRGEAPPYFEAIDLTPEPAAAQTQASPTAPAAASATASTPEPVPTRRSGFRTLLHSIPNRLSMHGRGESASSDQAQAQSQPPPREMSQSRTSHRPSPSGSSSIILTPFRTLSRQKSLSRMNTSPALTSPSLISLHSISAPLTHTLTRTEFTYPKAGPTPEQLKLISSRDSFARFGRPYGADAIAYAASASRQDLEGPPPDFEDSAASAPGEVRPLSPGPSRLREANAAMDFEGDVSAVSSSSAPPVAAAPSSSATAAETPSALPSTSQEPAGVIPESRSQPQSVPASPHSRKSSTRSRRRTDHADADADADNSTSEVVPSSPATTPDDAPPALAPAPAPLSIPKSSHSRSHSPTLPTPTAPHQPPPPPPPSAFRSPSTTDLRPESRASSLASFATAAESISIAPVSPLYLDIPGKDKDGERGRESDEETSAPGTPMPRHGGGGGHVLEGTDETIWAGPRAV
ncbi:hypothetical protein H0H81_010678 [Sphagnurus paluster]|uniref:Proteophosphoglycan ppg4 n=1 Tax=Sphagnurus paluster TaxID=117069 RepID=A0A9P7KHS5_9AGAR|nr:hypothetical protein H0H81_010678 [Sphagnurus paluster]